MRSAQDRSLRRWVSPRRDEVRAWTSSRCRVPRPSTRRPRGGCSLRRRFATRGAHAPASRPRNARWRAAAGPARRRPVAWPRRRDRRARDPRGNMPAPRTARAPASCSRPRGTEAGRQRGQRGQVSPGSDSWSMDEAEVSLVRPHESPDLQAAGLSARQTLVLRSRSTTPQPGVSFAPWIFS